MIDLLAQVVSQPQHSGIDPSILVTIIGAPAALITSIGTIWLIARRSPPSTTTTPSLTSMSQPRPLVEGEVRTNGYRFVTHHELREIIADIKSEIASSERRSNDKLDLIVALLKDR